MEQGKRAAGAEPKGVCKGQECDRSVVKLCQASIAASTMRSMVALVAMSSDRRDVAEDRGAGLGSGRRLRFLEQWEVRCLWRVLCQQLGTACTK